MKHNTPISNLENIRNIKYGLNQRGKIIHCNRFDFINDDISLKKLVFKEVRICKFKLNEKYLVKNRQNRVIMNVYNEWLIFMRLDGYLELIHPMKGKLKSVSIDNQLSNILDFGIIQDKLYFIYGDILDVYTIEIVDSHRTNIKFYGSEYIYDSFGESIRCQDKTVMGDKVYIWLLGQYFIIINICGDLSYEHHRLAISKKHTNHKFQQVVAGIKINEHIIMLFFNKGTFGYFNTRNQQTVIVANPRTIERFTKFNLNDSRLVYGCINLTKLEIELLINGYVRNNYTNPIPVVLIRLINNYYPSSDTCKILIGVMHHSRDIGKSFELEDMKILISGLYNINLGYLHYPDSDERYITV